MRFISRLLVDNDCVADKSTHKLILALTPALHLKYAFSI